MSQTDPNFMQRKPKSVTEGVTDFFKKASETSFYRKAMAYRPAFLRGGLGIAIAVLVWDKDNPGDVKGSILQGLVAWRLFIDSSMGQAKDEAQKIL